MAQTAYADAEFARAWEAVEARTRFEEAPFVYAVVTTGVYCVPGCPSRIPLRRNVRFFDTPEQARAAGFRACKRCRPDADASAGDPTVEAACRYLEDHLDEHVTLRVLGEAVAMSPDHLQRLFVARTGVSPREYAEALRVQRLKGELRGGAGVARAACEAGFGSRGQAHVAADRHLAMTPAQYAAGGKDIEISFDFARCRYGTLLVAVTARGVCAVSLADRRDVLEDALCAEYPVAQIRRGGAWAADLCGRVARLAEDPARDAGDIPLDVRATAFQWRVWRALRAIPAGQTVSYAQLARRLGEPGKARAVAGACAANPAALVIPCHRVVRSDGSIAGYRWGVDRKAAILAAEGATSR